MTKINLTLIDIIKDYPTLVDKVVCIFKKKYQIEDIIEGWCMDFIAKRETYKKKVLNFMQ